jgi:hypothetical protein
MRRPFDCAQVEMMRFGWGTLFNKDVIRNYS